MPGSARDEVDEVILGNALSGGGNVARLAALAAGLPDERAGADHRPAMLLRARRHHAGRAPRRGRRGARRACRRHRKLEPLRHPRPSPARRRGGAGILRHAAFHALAGARSGHGGGGGGAGASGGHLTAWRKVRSRWRATAKPWRAASSLSPRGRGWGEGATDDTAARATPHPTLSPGERASRSGGEGVRGRDRPPPRSAARARRLHPQPHPAPLRPRADPCRRRRPCRRCRDRRRRGRRRRRRARRLRRHRPRYLAPARNPRCARPRRRAGAAGDGDRAGGAPAARPQRPRPRPASIMSS